MQLAGKLTLLPEASLPFPSSATWKRRFSSRMTDPVAGLAQAASTSEPTQSFRKVTFLQRQRGRTIRQILLAIGQPEENNLNKYLTFPAGSWVQQQPVPGNTSQAWRFRQGDPSGSSEQQIWLRCPGSVWCWEWQPSPLNSGEKIQPLV